MKMNLCSKVILLVIGLLLGGFYPAAPASAVVSIAGKWNYTENASITCTVFPDGFDPETDTIFPSGSGVLTIIQNGSSVSWSVIVNGTSYSRSGTINGNQFQVSGPFIVPLLGSITLSSNTFTAQGPVSADGSAINLTGSGSGSGSGNYEGINFTFTCSGTSTATFSRPRVGFAAATSSGSESVTSVNLAVSLSTSASWPITVQYSVTGGSATGGGVDFTLPSGTLTFNPGQTTKNISVTVVNDTLDEPDQTIQVTLSNPTDAALGATAVHTYTITDNDGPPSLAINDVAVNEGNSGTTNAVFTVTLSAPSTQTVTVNYSTANNTATGGASCTGGTDYVSNSGMLTFTPGQTSQPISVQVCGDTVVEPNETFFVNLTLATNATIADGQGSGTILNDDIGSAAQEPSNIEQLIIYELNRARSNPARFAIENALPVDLSGVAPQPPLAVNNNLVGSASFHAEEMATFNYFAHQSAVTLDWPNKMARDNGYVLPGFYPDTSNNIESLAAGTSINTAVSVLKLLIEDAGVVPPGHRIQLLAMDSFFQTHREIGTGHAFNASATFKNYFAIHTAVSPGADLFLTGVVYNDANANGRYDLGEGLDNVNVSNGVTTVQTNGAGGWSIPVPAGAFTVTASGGSFTGAATAHVIVSSSNIEVDFISGNPVGAVNFNPDTVVFVPPLDGTAGSMLVGGVETSGLSRGPAFQLFSPSGALQTTQFALNSDFSGMSFVLGNLDADAAAEVLVGGRETTGLARGPAYQVFDTNGSLLVTRFVLNSDFIGTSFSPFNVSSSNGVLTCGWETAGAARGPAYQAFDSSGTVVRTQFALNTDFKMDNSCLGVDLDGVAGDEVIMFGREVTGAARGPALQAFNSNGTLRFTTFVLNPNFVETKSAVANISSPGIIVYGRETSGANRGPAFQTFNASGGLTLTRFILNSDFTNVQVFGANTTDAVAGDEIVTGGTESSGAARGPAIQVWDKNGNHLFTRFVLNPDFTQVTFNKIDIDNDGIDEILVVGRETKGLQRGPAIQLFDGSGSHLMTQFVLNTDFTNLRFFPIDQNGDGDQEIGIGGIEATGAARGPAYQIFESNGTLLQTQFVLNADF